MAKKAHEHLWSVAVQDVRTSSIRARALRLGRPELWLLYLELLLALQESGGTLPSNPEALVDEVVFWSVEELVEMLPLLRPAPGKRGGITIDGDTLRNGRMDDEERERAAFRAVASEMGQERARQAARGADGRMLPKSSEKPATSQRTASGKPTWFDREASERPAKKRASEAPRGVVLDQPVTSELPADDQRSSSVKPACAQLPYPIPTPNPTDLPPVDPSTDAENAAAAGNAARARPPEEAARPPAAAFALLDHDPNTPWEAELASVCRQVVEAGKAGDDVAALAVVTRTSRGKSMDGIWGAPEAWCRRSIATGLRLLGGSDTPVSPGPRPVIRDPEARAAAAEVGLGHLAGREPDVVLREGKAYPAAPPESTPDVGPNVGPVSGDEVEP